MEKQGTFFAENIKLLRTRKNKTQDIVATALGLTRGRLAAFESGQTKNPTLEDLITFSEYFQFSIDMLVRKDLSKVPESKLYEIEHSFDYTKGSQLRVITVTVDSQKKENIEYVPIKVKAGYMVNYDDPDFIKDLEKLTLPFVAKGKTMRMFESEGDSMFPLPEKAKVLGEYVEDWHQIKDGGMYIIISYRLGYAIKSVFKKLENNSLTLKSLNPLYPDYEIYLKDVTEIWKFKGYYSDSLPSLEQFFSANELLEKLEEMKAIVKRGVILK